MASFGCSNKGMNLVGKSWFSGHNNRKNRKFWEKRKKYNKLQWIKDKIKAHKLAIKPKSEQWHKERLAKIALVERLKEKVKLENREINTSKNSTTAHKHALHAE
jgi:hypothetical protein